MAWHAASHCLLIIEVKSRLLDAQATLATLDRKVRILPRLLAGERGWHPAAVGAMLAMPGLTANRSAVERHAATFATAFPPPPAGMLPVVGFAIPPDRSERWFLSMSNRVTGTQLRGTRRRVRHAKSRVASAPKGP